MTAGTIEADYLIVGAGAAGMAFADTLLTETEATIAIVDRNHRPGGHWNDAYPFVRLHQPSATYGVNSRALGSGRIDTHGLNQGYYELASGAEIVAYFEAVMRERFLPSGRVRYLPMTDLGADGVAASRLSGERRAITARKTVDATWARTQVPSARPPAFAVTPGMICEPPNALPRLAAPGADHVVIGAGKTAIDACCWLLENGADPDRIGWIMPRDPWLLDRGNFQTGDGFFERSAQTLAAEVEALAEAGSVDDVFLALEARGVWRRIDPAVNPTTFHCAIVSDGELEQLRRIRNIVRLGRVNRIDADRIVLEQGDIPTGPAVLHIDCSAPGIPAHQPAAIFAGDRITLQWVRLCQPTFSAAFIAHVEAAHDGEAEKNRLCPPIAPPQVPVDWLRMMAVELASRQSWAREPSLGRWIAGSRLDGFSARLRALRATDGEAVAALRRYMSAIGPAIAKLETLLA